jgi:hypothetical protein
MFWFFVCVLCFFGGLTIGGLLGVGFMVGVGKPSSHH